MVLTFWVNRPTSERRSYPGAARIQSFRMCREARIGAQASTLLSQRGDARNREGPEESRARCERPKISAHAVEHLWGTVFSSSATVRQLNGGESVALVLDRQETGRHRESRRNQSPDQAPRPPHGGIGMPWTRAPISRAVRVRPVFIDVVERPRVEQLRCRAAMGGPPQPHAHCVGLKVAEVDGDEQRGFAASPAELRLDAPRQAGQERPPVQEHRDQHQA